MASCASRALAIIPVRAGEADAHLNGRPLLAYTIEAARSAKTIDRTIVTTDSPTVRQLAISLGADAPFERPAELARAGVPSDAVLRHCVEWLRREEAYAPDIVVLLEITHPLRPAGLIDHVVETLVSRGLDTVFTAHEELHTFWRISENGELRRVGEDEAGGTRAPLYREVSGLVCATRAQFIRRGERLGRLVGVVAIRDFTALVDTRDPNGLVVAERLLDLM